MKIKSEKGVTGIDITVSIFIITLFVATITTLSARLSSNNKAIERSTKATQLAISSIETIKSDSFDKYKDYGKSGNVGESQVFQEEDITDTSFHKKISIIDYANMQENSGKENIQSDIIKKVTVEISYREGNDTKKVTLSTIIKKE